MLLNDSLLQQGLFGILFCLALASVAMLLGLRAPARAPKSEAAPLSAAEDTARALHRAALRNKLAAFKSAVSLPLQEAADLRLALRRATGSASRLPLSLAPWPNFDLFPGAVEDLPGAAAAAMAALPPLLLAREEQAAALRAPQAAGAALPLSPLQAYLQTMAEISLHMDAALESLEISPAGPSAYQQNLASQG